MQDKVMQDKVMQEGMTATAIRHSELITSGDVEIELLHQRDRFEVLRGDQRDRNVVDVELVLLDEMQQKIERTFDGLRLA